jgi:adenylate kinase family enzyme
MRICLYGGPGVGKSATASWLFSQLKIEGHRIELVSEYIKSWAWEKRVPASFDQYYIFAKQLHSEDKILRHGVDIITDSPLWLQIAYMEREHLCYSEECGRICKKFDDYPALNIFLQRTVDYQDQGRYENLKEAEQMDARIASVLERNNVNYARFDPKDSSGIFNHVSKTLKERQ